jgi:hypothetical protein
LIIGYGGQTRNYDQQTAHGLGFFHCIPVIPAKAGIQKHFGEKSGYPPGAGMTIILADCSNNY